ncbi:MAG: AI-2E family transporter [Aerococcus sp.]|nr:AI-2E family transporter [Aerococcus sp.]
MKVNLSARRVGWFIVLVLLALMGFLHPDVFSKIFTTLTGVVRPFLWGIAIAFVLSQPMKWIEHWLYKWRKKEEKWFRPLSIVLSLLLVGFIIWFVLFLALPDLQRTFGSFVAMVPKTINQSVDWVNRFIGNHPEIMDGVRSVNISPEDIQNRVTSVLNSAFSAATVTLSSVLGFTFGFVGIIFDLVVALVFAISLCFAKEAIIRQLKKAVYAFCSLEWGNYLVNVGHLANQVFSSFVSGQCSEALILGVLCYIGMSLLGFPFPLSVSVITGASTFIPFYGAFIGGGFGAVLIAMQNFWTGIWFVVFVIILQQLEGNLIYPRVVGSSVGLPSIWTLATVTVFGSLFGLVGMILSVPVTSLVYQLFAATVNYRLQVRGIEVATDTHDITKQETQRAFSVRPRKP